MSRIFATATLLLLTVGEALGQAAPCPTHLTCKECVGSPFCGWCSPGVIMFHNGSAGKRCADQRDKEAWACDGRYQTDECLMGYSCKPATKPAPAPAPNATCKPAGEGEGNSNASCTKTCGKKKADIYGCNNLTYTCEVVPAGTSGGASQGVCNSTCQAMSNCNSATWKCEPAAPGTPGALPAASCATACHDNSKFTCGANYTCEVSVLPFGMDKAACAAECVTPTPKPITPISLLGFWRGIEISAGFTKGEWAFNFEETSVQVYGPSDANWSATVSMLSDPSTGRTELWLVLLGGADAGKTMKALYQLGPNGPETRALVFACGEPDVPDKAVAPRDLDSAMGGSTYGEFLLQQCSDGAPACSFRAPADNAELGARPTARAKGGARAAPRLVAGRQLQPAPADACNAYKTCSDCVAHNQQCGWCSADVVYNDTSHAGAQCAGFNKQGEPSPPWHCPAHYSRTDCSDFVCDVSTNTCREALPGDQPPFITKEFCETELCKPVNDSQYACDHASFTCSEVPFGTPGASPSFEGCNSTCVKPPPVPGYQCSAANNWTCSRIPDGGVPSKAVCDASCVQPVPRNNTPAGLLGSWRGIGVQNGYLVGEWDVKLNKSYVQFTNTAGVTWAGVTGSGGGADLTFTVTDGQNLGKTIACLFTTELGAETVRMTLAMGVPAAAADAVAPTSYDIAVGLGSPVLVLAKCGGTNKYCQW